MKILDSRILAIDPSSGGSSQPGYALFENGNLVDNGEIRLDKSNPIQLRLRKLIDRLEKFGHIDVLAIERIRGPRTHESLKWAVGVTIAAVNPTLLLEINTQTWKRYTHLVEDYSKSDKADALAIGMSVFMEYKDLEL